MDQGEWLLQNSDLSPDMTAWKKNYVVLEFDPIHTALCAVCKWGWTESIYNSARH